MEIFNKNENLFNDNNYKRCYSFEKKKHPNSGFSLTSRKSSVNCSASKEAKDNIFNKYFQIVWALSVTFIF